MQSSDTYVNDAFQCCNVLYIASNLLRLLASSALSEHTQVLDFGIHATRQQHHGKSPCLAKAPEVEGETFAKRWPRIRQGSTPLKNCFGRRGSSCLSALQETTIYEYKDLELYNNNLLTVIQVFYLHLDTCA